MSDTSADTKTNLSFILDKDLFAIDIASVREILDFVDIVKIPQTPDYMRGVVNLRGNAIPVIDLRMRFGMGQTAQTVFSRIIILEVPVESETLVVGVMADAVKEVFDLTRDQIAAPPKMGAKVKADLIKGIGKYQDKFILLLDIDKVFAEEELVSLAAVAEAGPEAQVPEAQAAPGA